MNSKILFVLCSVFLVSTANAQTINDILASIDQNNTQLKALRKTHEATVAEMRAENTIGETAVEYSPFYQRGVSGLASSELIVSQEFDFPTLYAARRKSASLQQDMLDKEYLIARRDIMLNAVRLCYDLATTNENALLIGKRIAAADSLLTICGKRLSLGTTTIMEQNRVKMDRMTLNAEAAQNKGEIARITVELQRLGATNLSGGLIRLSADSTLAIERLGGDTEAILASSRLAASEQDIKTSQQGWLPKLTIGYRRNTEVHESLNGFLVGISMPLFANGKKVKAARLRLQASEQELTDARHQVESRRLALVTETENLKSTLSTYDIPLMQQTLSTLMRAVEAGELSIADYYTEADKVYAAMQEYITVHNAYNKALAELSIY